MMWLSTYFDSFALPKEARFIHKTINLAILSIRSASILDSSALTDFFGGQLPKSFFELSNWDLPVPEQADLIDLMLELGYALVRNGTNRFKAFIFYLPGIYTRISHKTDVPDK